MRDVSKSNPQRFERFLVTAKSLHGRHNNASVLLWAESWIVFGWNCEQRAKYALRRYKVVLIKKAANCSTGVRDDNCKRLLNWCTDPSDLRNARLNIWFSKFCFSLIPNSNHHVMSWISVLVHYKHISTWLSLCVKKLHIAHLYATHRQYSQLQFILFIYSCIQEASDFSFTVISGL